MEEFPTEREAKKRICWKNCGLCCYFEDINDCRPGVYPDDTKNKLLPYAIKNKITYHHENQEKIPTSVHEIMIRVPTKGGNWEYSLRKDPCHKDEKVAKLQDALSFPTNGKYSCIFLDIKTKLCRVYPVRPYTCAQFYVCKAAEKLYNLVRTNQINFNYDEKTHLYSFPALDGLPLKERIKKLLY